jgi:hypothetical protein
MVANPGSDEAVKKGCKCHVMNDHRGRGRVFSGELWVSEGCLLRYSASAAITL